MFRSLVHDGESDPLADGENGTVGYIDREIRYYRWKWWHAIIILIIVFPYICIPILFALVADCKSDSTTKKEVRVLIALCQPMHRAMRDPAVFDKSPIVIY